MQDSKQEFKTLTPEQEQDLAQKALSRMERRLESALLPKDKSVGAIPVKAVSSEPVADPHVSGAEIAQPTSAVIGSEAVHQGRTESKGGEAPLLDIDESGVRSGRKRREQILSSSPDTSRDAVTQTTVLPEAVAKEVTPAGNEGTPLAEGEYMDIQGTRYRLTRTAEGYGYEILKGEDTGYTGTHDAANMRAIMKVEGWRKADQAVSPLPESSSSGEEGISWTEERILAEIGPDGRFLLRSPGGAMVRYHRDGDDIYNAKNEKKTGQVLERLSKGWFIEEQGVVSTPVEAAAPVDTFEKKQYELRTGDVYVRTLEQGGMPGKEKEELVLELVHGDTVRVLKKSQYKEGLVFENRFETSIDLLRETLKRDGFLPASESALSAVPQEEESSDVLPESVSEPGPVPEGVASPELEGASRFSPLPAGGQARYAGTKGSVLVEREAEGGLYQMTDEEGATGYVYDEAHIESIAKEEVWVPNEGGGQSESGTPAEKEQEDRDPLMSRVEELRIRLGEARLLFVTADYEEHSVWSKLKSVFGKNISDIPDGLDARSARESYELLLMQLQDAQLALVKKEALAADALRIRMGEMLRYYKIDERVELAKTRQEVKIERRNFGQKIIAAAEQVGRFYNKLPRWQKYSLAGLSLGAGVFGGAAVGGGFVLARRAMTAAGLAVTADVALETWQEKKRTGAMEEEKESQLQVLEDTKEQGEYDFDLLSLYLQEDIDSLNEKFQSQKRQDIFRRSAVWSASLAGTFGGTYIASLFRELSPTTGATPTGFLRGMVSSTESSGPSSEVRSMARDLDEARRLQGSGNLPGESRSIAPRVIGEQPPSPAASASAEGTSSASVPREAVAPLPERGVGLLVRYDVTSADGKRGLWGILERTLPSDVPESDRPRIIESLERLMQQKLDAMSPAERTAAGFRTGSIEKIYAGTQIDFSKVLTKDEVASVLTGEAPSPVLGVSLDTVPEEGSASAVPASETETESQGKGSTRALPLTEPSTPDTVAPAASQVGEPAAFAPGEKEALLKAFQAEDMKSFANLTSPEGLKTFLAEHPEKIPAFHTTLGGLRQGVFLTNELIGESRYASQYDYTIHAHTMGRVKMSWALRNFEGFQGGVIRENAFDRQGFPLHSSQIHSLAKLVAAASDQKVFGGFGQVGAGETIDQYTRRIAALATALQKERVLNMALKGKG